MFFNLFSKINQNHRIFWNKNNIRLLISGVFLFLLSLIIQSYAYLYVENYISSTPVEDLLLKNLPTINLQFFVVQGPLILTFIVLLLFLFKPKYLPFFVKSLSFFIIVRSFFISLTHLGVSLEQIKLNTSSFGYSLYEFLYFGKNDFFFSAHTGVPFLLGLVFWQMPFWRYFFFLTSAIFGSSMILAHMHYSIDVFAAPFITYTIFVISRKFFKKDYQLINVN